MPRIVPTHGDLPENWQDELERHNARARDAADRAARRRAVAYAERKRWEDDRRAHGSVPPPRDQSKPQ